ncbi:MULTISPECIES: mycofactocin-coupled SDR family oxidoreductase [Nostocales]|uniref:Mycofactocin-coupled SDR family oxidoreductase n=3 Tax=Nostocales TaxID=1161 RepID=A0A8S9TFF5_9CYAN|nr:mycofactocin-coupled SDR family oxidoreductase [Tolypothrix bouteillei]KAF3890956.1 mycofactocin-coupled SDR family oxidoreductase [Tolypothrix bouteillei VB521301]
MKSKKVNQTRRNLIKNAALAVAGVGVGAGLSPKKAEAQPQKPGTAKSPAPSSLPLSGKVALVTGAARGIGLATAVELARQGADIALLDIAQPQGVRNIHSYRLANRTELEKAVRLVQAEGRRALPIVADVRDLAAMKQAAETTLRELGGLDILVANAGIAIWSPFDEMTSQQWSDVIDVNLTGVANSMWAVIPHMQKQKRGRIIAVSSIGGRMGVAGVANYSATKWGVIGLVKSVALELGQDNITVNAVAPGAVNTPLYRSEGQRRSTSANTAQDQDKVALAYHALPIPALEPTDVATAIAFLTKDDAQYISGAVLDVAAGGNARYTA